ncbi:hypothetical protein [Acrocarpospora corrugata]|uniref:hypothetical protein n=1 Tax=Acrocarpospora corrugata TaxID=35763 RepID=UPI0012D34579|nr:hypothetical protein [Acrocarpospora corrugata]
MIISLDGALSSENCATLHASLVRASAVHHRAQILIDATRLVSGLEQQWNGQSR